MKVFFIIYQVKDENWNNSVFNTYNPSSTRFSPFTFTPRDCIGKNFAQMEMRVILLHFFKNFKVRKINNKVYSLENVGYNRFTMGPRDINSFNKVGLNVKLINRFNSKL